MIRTQKGRVVYDRKKNLFESKDARRIIEKTSNEWYYEENEIETRANVERIFDLCASFLGITVQTTPVEEIEKQAIEKVNSALREITIDLFRELVVLLPIPARVTEFILVNDEEIVDFIHEALTSIISKLMKEKK